MAELPGEPRALRRQHLETLTTRKVLLIPDDVASATQLRALLPQNGRTVIVLSQSDLASSFARLHIITLEGPAVFPAQFTKRAAAAVCKVSGTAATTGSWTPMPFGNTSRSPGAG